jgi:hypothetical protein
MMISPRAMLEAGISPLGLTAIARGYNYAPCGETIEYQTGELRAEPVSRGALLSGRARSRGPAHGEGSELCFLSADPSHQQGFQGWTG